MATPNNCKANVMKGLKNYLSYHLLNLYECISKFLSVFRNTYEKKKL